MKEVVPDVDKVAQDALPVMARAIELFMAHLARESVALAGGRTLDYGHVATLVSNTDNLLFLRGAADSMLVLGF